MKITSDGQAQQGHLQGRDEELEDDQPWVTVYLSRILPAQCQDVRWLRTAVGQVASEC